MTDHTTKLNCSVGDLAITVNCAFPQNLGNIVRIISAVGFDEWQGFSEPLFTWNVQVATEGGQLFYQMEDGLEGFSEGLALLRRSRCSWRVQRHRLYFF
jgi:hypothetical protein